jgi:hypothetical protein
LEWLAPASLKSGEFYVVHVDYAVNGQKKSIVAEIKQGTNYKIDASAYPGPSASGTEFKWYVLIVSQNLNISSQARASTSSPGIAQSLPSESRTFIWY